MILDIKVKGSSYLIVIFTGKDKKNVPHLRLCAIMKTDAALPGLVPGRGLAPGNQDLRSKSREGFACP
ncbi:MAG: hypothetical protein ACUVRZ_04630 [Desulfobacca sp.]